MPLAKHDRVVVLGTSASGKTTFCRQLASRLQRPHIELDELHWGPNWQAKLDFAQRVADAVAGETWIVDGNYKKVRGITWPRATAAIWLNYSFPVVMSRALRRTCLRIVRRERLFAGNRESFVHSFLHPDGIPWWVLRTYHSLRRELRSVLATPEFAHLELFELRRPADAARLLAGIGPGCAELTDAAACRPMLE